MWETGGEQAAVWGWEAAHMVQAQVLRGDLSCGWNGEGGSGMPGWGGSSVCMQKTAEGRDGRLRDRGAES